MLRLRTIPIWLLGACAVVAIASTTGASPEAKEHPTGYVPVIVTTATSSTSTGGTGGTAATGTGGGTGGGHSSGGTGGHSSGGTGGHSSGGTGGGHGDDGGHPFVPKHAYWDIAQPGQAVPLNISWETSDPAKTGSENPAPYSAKIFWEFYASTSASPTTVLPAGFRPPKITQPDNYGDDGFHTASITFPDGLPAGSYVFVGVILDGDPSWQSGNNGDSDFFEIDSAQLAPAFPF